MPPAVDRKVATLHVRVSRELARNIERIARRTDFKQAVVTRVALVHGLQAAADTLAVVADVALVPLSVKTTNLDLAPPCPEKNRLKTRRR
jgi:hypothetical protein